MRALLALDPDNAEALNFIGYGYAERGCGSTRPRRCCAGRWPRRRGAATSSTRSAGCSCARVTSPRAVELLEQAVRLSARTRRCWSTSATPTGPPGAGADAVAAWRRALGSLGDEPPAEQLRLRASLERKLSSVSAPAIKPVAR